jgi:hypothetical protein
LIYYGAQNEAVCDCTRSCAGFSLNASASAMPRPANLLASSETAYSFCIWTNNYGDLMLPGINSCHANHLAL